MIRRALSLVAINLALLLAVMLAAELAFGTWLSRDPLDRLSLPRDFKVMVDASTLYPDGRSFPYRRDHWGFRGPGIDPAAVDVVTIGGSTTNQLYLPDEQTWQAALERALTETGHPVRIANAGIDGQSTVGHLRNLESWLPNVPGLKPKVVLAYVGINDTHNTGPSVDRLEHSSMSKRWRQSSALFRLWTTAAGAVAARQAKLNHSALDYAAAAWTDVPNRPDDGLLTTVEAYQARLKRMAALIRGLGARPVFVTQMRGDARVIDGRLMGLAEAEGPNGLDQHRLLETINAATREVCREEGLFCLDPATDLSLGDGDFYDRLHNTPQGAEKLGRWMAAKLAAIL